MANSDDKDDNDDNERLMIHHWGVFKYKGVSDLNVSILQPRDMNFMGRNTFTGSNFFHDNNIKSNKSSFAHEISLLAVRDIDHKIRGTFVYKYISIYHPLRAIANLQLPRKRSALTRSLIDRRFDVALIICFLPFSLR